MMSPLLGRTPVAASLFFAQGYSFRTLAERAPSLNSIQRNFLSGMFSGFIYLNVSFPFDFLKILMQSKIGQQGVTYWGEIKSIYQREGFFGFTRGYSGQMLRDVPGFALYFGLFELIKIKMKVSDQDRRQSNYSGLSEKAVFMRKFVSGGMAAILSWTVLFPLDTLKTQMQSTQAARVNGLRFLYRSVKENGLRAQYRGVHVQLMRSFPTGACTMLVLDTVRTKLHAMQP